MRSARILLVIILLSSCNNHFNKILKNKDSEYKLRMAEQYYVKKQYNKAQQLYEEIIPYFKARKEFEDIYYKYAYCAWYQEDYMNAENLFKGYLEAFANSPRAEEIDFMRAKSFYMESPRPELDQTNTLKAIGAMQTFINTHPGSTRIKEGNDIIDICRTKLETKEAKSAQLYYDLGQFKAAGVAFSSVLNSYPESTKADEYKLMIIKSYYQYAELSVEEKKQERFEQVIAECNDFADRFPDSKLKKEAEHYLSLSQINLKKI